MQLSQLLGLHLQHFLQVGDILLQRGEAILSLLQRLVLGDSVGFRITLLGGWHTLGCHLGTRDLDLILVLLGWCSFFLELRGNLARTALPGRLFLRRPLGNSACQLLTISTPIPRTGDIDLLRLCLGHRLDARLVGDGEDRTGFQTIDVVADKGVRIVAEQANQHLLQRHPVVAGFIGDLAQRIARHDFACACRFSRLARCLSHFRRCRRPRFGPHRRRTLFGDRTAANGFNDARIDNRLRRLLGCNFRRIEQESVFANETPGWPVQLNQKVEEGLVDRPPRRHLDHRFAVGPRFDGKAQIQQRRGIVNAGLAEGILRRQSGRHARQLVLASPELHFGAQGLPQTGKHGQFAQAGGFSEPGSKGQT